MPQPTFPLFRPVNPEPPDDLPMSVVDVLHHEVQRAALEGSDPTAVPRIRLTLDLNAHTVDALQALAIATGSSRRAMATKLLDAAVWEAIGNLYRQANAHEAAVEYQAVLAEFEDAHALLRKQREQEDAA